MQQYRDLLQKLVDVAEWDRYAVRPDRTGVGTYSIFGHQMRFDLQEFFPLLETKFTSFEAINEELQWFLRGSTNTNELDSNIWDAWSTSTGDLGPIYGKQWRNWGERHVDQIKSVVRSIKLNPNSRRHLISAWNADDLPIDEYTPQENVIVGRMALAPCHVSVQFYVKDGKLSSQLYQRSGDVFLGVPYNIASYALLTAIIAKECDLELGEFVHTFGDVHLYSNHLRQAMEYLAREEQENKTELWHDGDEWVVLNYNPQPSIKAEVAV